jgi:hypothetical protein
VKGWRSKDNQELSQLTCDLLIDENWITGGQRRHSSTQRWLTNRSKGGPPAVRAFEQIGPWTFLETLMHTLFDGINFLHA